MQYGLKPLPPDTRDLSVGALYTLPKLSEIPDSFDVGTSLDIKDQQESDFCSAYASTSASELQEGIEMEPAWLFAMSKTLSGDVEDWGQDLRTIMRASVKFGGLERRHSPYSIQNRSADFLRRAENWDDALRAKALEHKKASFMDCKGQYDAFGNLRATIWRFRKEKRAVVSGLLWGWDTKAERINDIGNPQGGHAILYRGWKGEYLIMQNSYGKEAGRNGIHLVHRNVVNKYVSMYGAYMFQDISVEEARWYRDNGTKVDKNWLINLWRSLVNL